MRFEKNKKWKSSYLLEHNGSSIQTVQRKERRRKKQLVFILNEQNESHLVTFCSMHVHDKQKHYIMVRLFDMTDVF